LQILILTKRQYMNKDLLDDRFGRFREIPLSLAKMGHHVKGICLSYQEKDEGWIMDGPVIWKSINAGSMKVKGLFQFIFSAHRCSLEADIIWACSDSLYGIIGCFLGKLSRKPVIFDIYDNFGNFFMAKLPVVKQLYHWAIRRSTAITCLSIPFAQFITENYAPEQHVYSVEFAVRTDLFKPMDKHKCRQMLDLPLNVDIIGTAGALYKKREVELLLEAFEKLRMHHPDLHLALAGPRDIKIPQNRGIHDCGILPFETVPYFINSLDVAVVCYGDDDFGKYCFPQKTREFMACNVPVVASNVGGLKGIFKKHPEWLYEPGNPDDLARVIEERLDNRNVDYGVQPHWEDLAKKVETIMNQLCKS